MRIDFNKLNPQGYAVGLTLDDRQVTFATLTGAKLEDTILLVYEIVRQMSVDASQDTYDVAQHGITTWSSMHDVQITWTERMHASLRREAMAIPVINTRRGIVTWYYQRRGSEWYRAVVGCVTHFSEIQTWSLGKLQQRIAQMMDDMRDDDEGHMRHNFFHDR